MENQRQIIKGMKVKVGDDLNKTYREFGASSDGEMDRMRGKIFEVQSTLASKPFGIKLKSPEVDFNFTFHQDDVTIIDSHIKIKYPNPQVFDPKQLDI